VSALKIFMLNHEFPPVGGGASPVTLELCRHLVRKGNEVDMVTMHFKGTPRFECIDGINIYRTPALRNKADICHTHELATYLPGALIKTLRLVKRRHYDIIHCHFMVPGAPLAWLASRYGRIPFLVTCHGTDVPGHNPERFNLIHKLIAPAWRFLTKRAAIITSPSQFLKEAIVRACPVANVTVIPNGIALDRFTPTQKTNRILMCSRILAFKGFQHVIEAIKNIPLDWQVTIIGDGPYLPELKQSAKNSKVPIHFTGWLDKNNPEFIRLYNESAIFVFPSQAENFPTVLLEAMSARMAIITSDTGGCKEVVGQAAKFIKPGDVKGIQAAILDLTQDDSKRESLAQAALERAQQFSWDTVTDTFIKTYHDLIRPSFSS
jgi:glycosyltransferase involved in cell wall biosynthesis